jgi:hypothetical protein
MVGQFVEVGATWINELKDEVENRLKRSSGGAMLLCSRILENHDGARKIMMRLLKI